MKAEHPASKVDGLLIRPSDIFNKRSLQEEKNREELEALKEQVEESRETCIRLIRGRNLDIDGPDGAVGEESETEQLNPVQAQEAQDDQMEEQERSTSAKQARGKVAGGLGSDVATEEEKAGEEGEEEGEEGREAVASPAPRTPSRMEREQHDLTHTPYRAWCPHCVRMRGRNTAHKKNVKREKSWIPRISFDYFFFSQEDEHANKNHDSHGG